VLSGSISRSLILDEALIDVGKLRLKDSVIGAKTTIKAWREVHGEARFVISDYSIVEL
jgi:glucose-1-phosphate thymidylyltransferase